MNVYQKQFEKRRETSAYWHNKSQDLLVSARTLSNAMQNDNRLEINCQAPYKMLMGMAFELLFKCHCVDAEVSFRHTHNLVELASAAGLSATSHEIAILRDLSAFIVWDGRYPVPKTSKLLEEHWKHQSNSVQCADSDFEKLLPIWRRFSDLYLLKHQDR